MQQYHRTQAGEAKITRQASTPDHARPHHFIYRATFLRLVTGWQGDSEPLLCARIIRASNWGFRMGGLLPDELAVVSEMIRLVKKPWEKAKA